MCKPSGASETKVLEMSPKSVKYQNEQFRLLSSVTDPPYAARSTGECVITLSSTTTVGQLRGGFLSTSCRKNRHMLPSYIHIYTGIIRFHQLSVREFQSFMLG